MDGVPLNASFLGATFVALLILFCLYMSFCSTRRARHQARPNYAFTASTKVSRRTPTVLQFSARVPPGAGATPTIVQSFDGSNAESRDL